MHARTTLLDIDPLRISVDDAVAMFEREVLPELREQPGFLGVYVLVSPDARAMLVSFWETAEAAEAAGETGWYADTLSTYMTLFRSPPGRDRYEVRLAQPPVPAGNTQ